MVEERKIGRETGVEDKERETQPQRGRRRDRAQG